MRSIYLTFFAVAIAGCGTPAASPPATAAPPGFGHPTALADANPDPNVVEVTLVAGLAQVEYLAGKQADVWAFRDGASMQPASVPGPLLETKAGDHVIVHFRNELPEATTIHWHGLRVPNTADGTPAAQTPVAPGGTFDYRFDTPDAGTFWYHPHVHGDVQVENGLQGPIVVHGGIVPTVAQDRVFIIDDVKLESTGKLSKQIDSLDLMLGRQGNVLLANGTVNAAFEAKAGTRERWRFINSANGRFFNLQIPGHRLLVIGWDGGLLAAPYEADTLLIVPGERYEVLVTLDGAPGDTLALQNVYYDRGHDIPDPGPQELFHVKLIGPPGTAAALPDRFATFEPLATTQATPHRSIVLSEKELGLKEPQFFINGQMFPDVPPITARPGDVEIWDVKNDSEMDHPFHLHGMFFQVLDVDGVAPAQRGWKDTVDVPQKKTLRFAVRYGDPGKWMYHCHIQEHAERGMMGELLLAK